MMGMSQLHMDIAEKVIVLPEQHNWVSNPADGVSRMLLERGNLASGHNTSLVTFAPHRPPWNNRLQVHNENLNPQKHKLLQGG